MITLEESILEKFYNYLRKPLPIFQSATGTLFLAWCSLFSLFLLNFCVGPYCRENYSFWDHFEEYSLLIIYIWFSFESPRIYSKNLRKNQIEKRFTPTKKFLAFIFFILTFLNLPVVFIVILSLGGDILRICLSIF